jgi:hypothetical protein
MEIVCILHTYDKNEVINHNFTTLNDRSPYFFFQVAPQHEAEWTPFQSHYLSKNLLASGIEPGAQEL